MCRTEVFSECSSWAKDIARMCAADLKLPLGFILHFATLNVQHDFIHILYSIPCCLCWCSCFCSYCWFNPKAETQTGPWLQRWFMRTHHCVIHNITLYTVTRVMMYIMGLFIFNSGYCSLTCYPMKGIFYRTFCRQLNYSKNPIIHFLPLYVLRICGRLCRSWGYQQIRSLRCFRESSRQWDHHRSTCKR